MAREIVDLYNVGTEPEQLQDGIRKLREDFDAHTHDGVSSRSIETLRVETLIARSATIGGHRLFEAVVGPSNSDYKTVAAALNAGKTRIFVRNGTYTSEPKWIISNANTVIVGESVAGVSITFAQDTVNSRSIYVNATRFVCLSMKLISYEAAQQTLFEFSSSGTYPICQDLMVRNQRGKFFAGSTNIFGVFRNVYLDMTATLDSTLMKGFFTINNSLVENAYFDMIGLTSAGGSFIDTCSNTQFVGCRVRSDDGTNIPVINNSATCTFVGCYFYLHEIAPHANFSGCFFENNGSAPSGYFLDITVASIQIVGCRIKVSAGDNLLRCTAAQLICNDNIFDGGKEILFSPSVAIKACQFSNNLWFSSYTVAAMDLELNANTNNYNILGNVVRNTSNSFLPTITNGGTANNSVNNQLIQG